MQYICKMVASLNPWRQNAKWRKTLTDSSPSQNMSESQYSCIIQEPMNISLFLSFFGLEANHWTKRMVNTRLTTQDPRDCAGPEDKGPTFI